MASLNSVSIIGNLGRDPEIRYAPNGDCIANISVGSTEKWRDKNSGEMKEQTEWHRISVFGKSAEYLSSYAKKGAQIFVHGALRTRKWQDKDGQDKYTTEIRADDVQLLGSRPQSAQQNNAGDDYQDYQTAPANNGGNNRNQSQQGNARSNTNAQGNNNQNSGQQRGNDRNQGQPQRSGGGGSYNAPSMDDIPF
ncbi:MAG: single-stranded DNA-binding protein [Rhodocyclaceae bacterium]|nr:single-stranded DNA-binding protein [Rhodocyclaceae bacterium]